MRLLLVYPEFPTTYWGFQHALPLIGKRATLPPLGLISVAALLPQGWEMRLVDMNVEPLRRDDVSWADVVLVGGMLVQEPSLHQVLAQARQLGRRTVVGGPACTTSPDRFDDADCLFLGEAEERVDALVAAIEARPEAPRVLQAPAARPSLHEAPIPRFDLLEMRQYRSMCIQISRGCPFTCEFCDIIEMFGRVPRVKRPEQITAELDALLERGHRGEVFIVDDNFIGNKKAVRPILGELARWQRQAGYPFTFYTEASLNLAADDGLVEAMHAANFTSVFIGIETPDPEALKRTGKKQNVGVDVRAALDKLTAAGLEVMAGFIVGFDGDGSHSFDAQRELLRDAPLPLAMAGLLAALPGTALWRRLEREGRLRDHSDGDAFARPNFKPTMPERELVEGYARLLADLYAPEAYFRRSAAVVDRIGAPVHPTPLLPEDVTIALRALYRLGILGAQRAHFWRLLARALPRGVHALRTAIACAVRGEHMIRYTEEVVLPRLMSALDRMAAEPAAGTPRRVSLPVLDASLAARREGPAHRSPLAALERNLAR
ncbi:MAG TPA: B12-binding domain-containing radical SAM protein [Polyangiaceae bacterium]|nr:B12-binding domain-containing radical SAM protein [Polyangiaceae bacterium]